MKNSKLAIAFVAGVILTVLLADTARSLFRHLHLAIADWLAESSDALGGLGLAAIIVVGVALILRFANDTKNQPPGKFFQFLREFRASRSDRWLGGICGGLGRVTQTPSWIWRMGFALALFAYGVGLITYLLLWLVVPAEGQPVAMRPVEELPGTFKEFLHALRRSDVDCWLGGVCGGLAEQTVAPAWVWRLGFIGLTFLWGIGPIMYIVLWIFLPRTQAKPQSTT